MRESLLCIPCTRSYGDALSAMFEMLLRRNIIQPAAARCGYYVPFKNSPSFIGLAGAPVAVARLRTPYPKLWDLYLLQGKHEQSTLERPHAPARDASVHVFYMLLLYDRQSLCTGPQRLVVLDMTVSDLTPPS